MVFKRGRYYYYFDFMGNQRGGFKRREGAVRAEKERGRFF